MADSEQQDILGRLIHIYECDEQQVSALIVPTDGQIRGNLPVSIEDADSDTIYTTTTTDANGMINTTFSLSPGTHTPIVKCGNDTHNIYDTGVVSHACSLTLTSDKDILSAADNDVATITATLTGTESGYNGPLSGREITFEIYKASDDTLIETLTATTDNSGIATVSYTSKGAGDLYIKSSCTFVSKTYSLEDCNYYNSGTITGSQTLNIPNLPVSFKATYKMKATSTSDDLSWLNIGNDANNCFFFGQIGSDTIGIFKRVNGTNASLNHKYSVVQQNVEYLMEFTYNNGALTLVGCGQTLTGSFTETNRGFVSTNVGANNIMKELKIKPL